jgi:hypothetical protein
MTVVAVEVHPCEVVVVTVYVPGDRLLSVEEVPPVDHRNVYGAAPPEGFTVAVPLLAPLQSASVFEVVRLLTGLKATTAVSVEVVPILSVMVTV